MEDASPWKMNGLSPKAMVEYGGVFPLAWISWTKELFM